MAFETIKSGWMYRQTSITKKWKRQWFKLTTDGLFRYFEGELSSSAEDVMIMRHDCLNIRSENDILGLTPPAAASRACLLQIEFRKKTWNLCAETPDDMKTWKFVLEEARIIQGPTAVPAPIPNPAITSYSAPCAYPRQQPIQQTVVYQNAVPNQVTYVNGVGSQYTYTHPTPFANQQVIHHGNGQTTVVVNNTAPTYYRHGRRSLFYW